MAERTVEDRLREEYFALLPDIRRVAEELETKVRHCLLPISSRLDRYEQLAITSRIKECDSALDALRRRQEFATFDRDQPERYTLSSLKDLAGVRVSVFPRRRWNETDQELHKQFSSWEPDLVRDESGELLAFKYYGYCNVSDKVRGEFQVVPMLTALFWEVEHTAIYKPSPILKGVARSLEMQQRTTEVLKALQAFEEEFESLVQHDRAG
ncbi:MAG TPA: hypothetical protein VNY30_24390 [Bryobacteraceae bacterium]|nr:hypothetical protein [Bryobacteraceae bacterium]